ncbi:DENN domain-containing protein 5B-like [Pollicipes pollicipes]|uniref:DENN domain-containing protein 5B-like n=1 Tax=Pollicipes pollicipes TaxID=41117 RepID=UPI001884BB09|nr:DENN domain-containing protein 5B-like [Pollicipes pollicipes]
MIDWLNISSYVASIIQMGCEMTTLQTNRYPLSPLERSYAAEVLGHYPESRSEQSFDPDATRMLALPRGLQFRTQKHSLAPAFHSFVVTREDGSRLYGFAYTFFERVDDRATCDVMHTLQSRHLAEVSSAQTSGQSGTSRSLPRHFKLATKLTTHAQSYYDVTKDQLYACKCIGLLMMQPYLQVARVFLTRLYRHSRSPSSSLPLEAYVAQLLFGLSVPPPGRSSRLPLLGAECVLQRPTVAELPVFEYPLRELFTMVGVEKMIQILSCMLLEHQIVLYAHDHYKLMLVAESLSALLFPFSWPHVYVPVLPASLAHFLDAPVPYLMGLHGSTRPSQQDGAANACLLDLEGDELELPEELPQFPSRQELVLELTEQLARFNVQTHHLDRNCNERMRSVGTAGRRSRRRKPSWTAAEPETAAATGPDHAEPTRTEPGTDTELRHKSEGPGPGSGSGSGSNPSPAEPYPGQSESMRRIAQLVKDAGLDPEKLSLKASSRRLSDGDQYIEDQKCNNAIREIFLNRFVHIFHTYEHFVIQPDQDMESWLYNRESTQNFDKVTFLSDQPHQDLPFLSRFIETQMFTSFVDNKILSSWGEVEPALRVFDSRIRRIRTESEGLVRTPSYERCSTISETERILERRLRACLSGRFPLLDAELVASGAAGDERGGDLESAVSLRRRERQRVFSEARQQLQSSAPLIANTSLAAMRENNWKFVDQALKECKSRTKRMLVEKMGTEAAALGHGEASIVGVEENTLIASLCDLMERIWSHGLQSKQGKSSLWSHLLNYQELETCKDASQPIDSNFLSPAEPAAAASQSIADLLAVVRKGGMADIVNHIADVIDLSSMSLEPDSTPPSPSRSSRSGSGGGGGGGGGDGPRSPASPDPLKPLPVAITFDMRNVLAMSEIKTEIGYARAWVRLSLEKKLLSKHLRALLSDNELLRNLYKRYAFLRSEEEREQFLCHLLSLNAVDYFCFTTSYPNTVITYRVVIFTTKKTSAATTTANAWVRVSGSLAETGPLPLPKGARHTTFKHKNLGLLTTVQLGHDNTGMSPNWLVEHVVVRSEVTGQTYKFACGRWLGRSIDDGSTERVLVGEPVSADVPAERLASVCSTPPRCRSPSVPRRPHTDASSVQHALGDAVNSIVKYFHRPEKERGSLTLLLCGESGLVPCLEQVFGYGYRSSRLFGKNFYLWDYLGRVQLALEAEFLDREGELPAELATKVAICRLVYEIDQAGRAMGKDDKFQVWLLIAVRDRQLSTFVVELAACSVTQQMYDEASFLRDPELSSFLAQIMASLHEYDLVLERSLTRGVKVGRTRRYGGRANQQPARRS